MPAPYTHGDWEDERVGKLLSAWIATVEPDSLQQQQQRILRLFQIGIQ